ncbi:DUF3221 domain-containing protein [Isachenkonia alkalipeptolytica]|uniref:DUF3221 domain-containing protein n=1 Tax=Isachenkonia alkalipeptolytica TaxID=2565777 RepID=A0AA44BDE3_9CLOT|nr:DUF3221 domain-containing protein [Isachenkonia alkalipeptolytica]NBG87823.1 DUF3221 domain-containing protein [Isachenkonia alkalipeptolytica]
MFNPLFNRRKLKLLSVALFLVVFTASCGTSLDPTVRSQEGYIVDITEERIYVISHVDREDIGELSEEELLEKSVEASDDRDLIAVWYNVNDVEDYAVGQYVEVRSREVMDSFPQQADAAGITILDEP